MFDPFTPLKLILALILGAVVGLERESYDKNVDIRPKYSTFGILGVRSFALVSTLGAIAGFMYHHYIGLFLTITIAFFVMLIAHYILDTLLTKDVGMTTELAVMFTYLIGLSIALDLFPTPLTIAITVVLILILSQKESIRGIVMNIQQKEINAFIGYSLITGVILPFLPNKSFSFNDIPYIQTFLSAYGIHLDGLAHLELINPFKLWVIVVLITGIDLVGYFLGKLIGQKKGLLIASGIGGFISSTATTISLAQESKRSRLTNRLVAAAIFANLTSFFQLFALIAPLNPHFLIKVTKVLCVMIISAAVLCMFFLKKKDWNAKDDAKIEHTSSDSIFSIGPALRFALVFLLIGFVTKASLILFGNAGFFTTSALAGLTGLDAITITISELVGSKIDIFTGVLALILVNAVNLGSKSFYSFLQGSEEFAIKFGVSAGIIILLSYVSLIFL